MVPEEKQVKKRISLRQYIPLLLAFLAYLTIPPVLADQKNLLGKTIDYDLSAANKRKVERLCSEYQILLQQYELDNAKVRRFRDDYLKQQYNSLLGRYGELWVMVHEDWRTAPKKFKFRLQEYARAYRQAEVATHKRTWVERRNALRAINNKYRDTLLKEFVDKFYITRQFDHKGWAYEIRRGQDNRVFPTGSVLEIREGKLLLSRYSRVKVEPELGGFIMRVRASNNLNGSMQDVVLARENFRKGKAAEWEILQSARNGAEIDHNDANPDESTQRLKLYLDKRYDACVAKTLNPQAIIPEPLPTKRTHRIYRHTAREYKIF